jgi:hypothetical protein
MMLASRHARDAIRLLYEGHEIALTRKASKAAQAMGVTGRPFHNHMARVAKYLTTHGPLRLTDVFKAMKINSGTALWALRRVGRRMTDGRWTVMTEV